MRTRFLLPLLFLLAAPLAAQVTIVPPNPTEADNVQLQLFGCGINSVTRNGNAFVIDINGCPFEPPFLAVPLGHLAPGTYTYQVTQNGLPYASGSFVVAPSIPALSPWALIALGALLCGVAIARYNFL